MKSSKCPAGSKVRAGEPSSLCHKVTAGQRWGSSQEVAFFFMKPHLLFLSMQIWKNLPHLKAVVTYREPPPKKMANVYTVWVEGPWVSGGASLGPPS